LKEPVFEEAKVAETAELELPRAWYAETVIDSFVPEEYPNREFPP